MYYYKNTSRVEKTFYGVTFKPGEVAPVPGYINDVSFIRVSTPVSGTVAVSRRTINSGARNSAKKIDNQTAPAATQSAKKNIKATKQPANETKGD